MWDVPTTKPGGPLDKHGMANRFEAPGMSGARSEGACPAPQLLADLCDVGELAGGDCEHEVHRGVL